MWKLVIEDDEGKRTVVPLTRDAYTIGRKEGNSIRLTERNVSRDHAKLARKPGTTKEKPLFILSDVSSYNGVYVNGLRVADAQDLSHGDLIQIGDYRIVLQDEAVDVSGSEEVVALDSDDLNDALATGPAPSAAVKTTNPLRATNATFLEKPNRLVVLAGPNPGEEFPLVGDRLTIGRAEDATISINHNSVSRLHCEVHSLGEGRFEIVDKGSSNGVRVNGADLRRGIIEAGDVIELGDVKFKFVGEGQLFRPGTTESQQLAALSNRNATDVVKIPTNKSALVPAVLVGAVLAFGVIAVYFLKSRPPPVAPPPTLEPVSSASANDTSGVDIAMLADARRMCDVGQVEEAHQKANSVSTTSPVRGSTDFKYIEFKWAATALFQAEAEPDPTARAAILQRVVSDPDVDPATKKTAAARLAAIDLNAHDAGKHGAGNHTGAAPSPARPAAPTTDPGTRPALPHPSAPQRSLSDLASSSDPADWAKARDILDPKVFGKRGTPDDVRMLRAICKAQHDQQCVTELKAL